MGVRHVGVTVWDIERSILFYEKLGFKLRFKLRRSEPFIGVIVGYYGAELLVAMLTNDYGATIELLQYLNPRGLAPAPCAPRYSTGQMHVCFEFDHALHRGLEEQAFLIGSATIPDGPQAGAVAEYWYGPDYELIEVFMPKDEK